MSYSDDCDVPRVHFFSNPGVMLYDKPTGLEYADNARAFELNMVRQLLGRCQQAILKWENVTNNPRQIALPERGL